MLGWFPFFPRESLQPHTQFAKELCLYMCLQDGNPFSLSHTEHFCTYRWWEWKFCFCFCHSLAQCLSLLKKKNRPNNVTEHFFQREFRSINKIMVTSVTNTALRQGPLQGHVFFKAPRDVSCRNPSTYWYKLGGCERQGWSMNKSVLVSGSLNLSVLILFLPFSNFYNL